MRVRLPVSNCLIVTLAIAALSSAACVSGGPKMQAPTEVAPTSRLTSPARGTESVPTPAPTPSPDPAIWRNGTVRCPMPPHVTVPPNDAALGDATKSFCIVWSGDFPDESGFRVLLTYYEGGDIFSHTVGPDEHDFVFPPEEAPVLTGPECTKRRSFPLLCSSFGRAGKHP